MDAKKRRLADRRRVLLTIKDGLDTPVQLFKDGGTKFKVEYGKEVKARLNYDQAATELGFCVMHSLQCKGVLDK